MLQVDFRVSAVHADPRLRSGLVCQFWLLNLNSTNPESSSGGDSQTICGINISPR